MMINNTSRFSVRFSMPKGVIEIHIPPKQRNMIMQNPEDEVLSKEMWECTCSWGVCADKMCYCVG